MRGTSTTVSLRIKLRCGEVSCSRKIFRARFPVNVKRPDVCAFIDVCRTVPNKFPVLRIVLQRHVRLEKPIDQFFLLVLSACRAENSQEQYADAGGFSHGWQAAAVSIRL